MSAFCTARLLKPCPHCRRNVRLSPKTARKRRQLPNSASVALFCDSVDRLLYCSLARATGRRMAALSLSTLSQKSATICRKKCDCRIKVRLSPNSVTVAVVSPFLRQSHFSATVWTGLKALRYRLPLHCGSHFYYILYILDSFYCVLIGLTL